LVVCKLDNQWHYIHIGGNMTGLIVSAEFNTPTSLLGILQMVMATVRPITIKYDIIANQLFTDALNNTQIHCLWY
jgi:hypothetical protein